jgi:hypothetical protein
MKMIAPPFPLRLAKSLRDTAGLFARRDGVSLNHFINLAVAEKISRLESTAATLESQVEIKPPAKRA